MKGWIQLVAHNEDEGGMQDASGARSKAFELICKKAESGDAVGLAKLLRAHPGAHSGEHPECDTMRFYLSKTPLMFAAAHGHLDCVEKLLPLSNASARCTLQQCTALDYAANNGHAAVVELLCRHCDPNEVAPGGVTPLMLAVRSAVIKHEHERCVQILLQHSDARQADRRGDTALMWAAGSGRARHVESLLPHSNPNHRNLSGKTALMLAAENGRVHNVRALLPWCDVHAVSEMKSQNALMLSVLVPAFNTSHAEIVELLMERTDLTRTDREGCRAVHLAIAARNWVAADLLCARLPLKDSQRLLRAAKAPLEHMPHAFSRQERESLAMELGPTPGSTRPQPPTPPSPATQGQEQGQTQAPVPVLLSTTPTEECTEPPQPYRQSRPRLRL